MSLYYEQTSFIIEKGSNYNQCGKKAEYALGYISKGIVL